MMKNETTYNMQKVLHTEHGLLHGVQALRAERGLQHGVQALRAVVRRRCGWWGVALAGLVLTGGAALVACSDDEAGVTAQSGDLLQMIPYMAQRDDVVRTRAMIGEVEVPDHFVEYSTLYPRPTIGYSTIGVFMAPEDANNMGTYTYLGDEEKETSIYYLHVGEADVKKYLQWESNVYVQEGMQYYFYGFMPSELMESGMASIQPYGSDLSGEDKGYAAGAILHLQAMQLLSPSDPCVVVGVEDITSPDGFIDDEIVSITGKGDVKLGKFDYKGKKKRRNYVRMLLDHLYCGVHFKFCVDDGYSALRTIHLRKMVFSSTIGSTINCDITLVANVDGNSPILPKGDGGSGGSIVMSGLNPAGTSSALVFDDDEVIPTASSGNVLSILGCFAPAVTDIGKSMSITVTYDVYDAADELLIREGCTATNRLPDIPDMKRGEKYDLTITVNPTYLYQLADPDLDSPAITFSH